MEKTELNSVLKKHKKWLDNDEDGKRANLGGAKVLFPLACPEKGAFVAFKKGANGAIIKLRIPEDARRSSATTQKCRCDKAVVLSIENPGGTPYKDESVCSLYDRSFIYTIGQEVTDYGTQKNERRKNNGNCKNQNKQQSKNESADQHG